jgi:hypothetical protein
MRSWGRGAFLQAVWARMWGEQGAVTLQDISMV